MDRTLFLLMCFMCVFSTNPDFKRAKKCYVSVGYNIDYQGSEDSTASGSPCVNWKTTTWASSDFDGTMDNPYCRNPDKDENGPWCIVKSGIKEFCTIPKCASSAMFDGTGNIDHQFGNLNSTTSDNISLTFYTNVVNQNEATIFAVRSWGAGLLEIKLQSDVGYNDYIKLMWKFERNRDAVQVTSRPNKANGELVRINVIRNGRSLKMWVNDEQYTTSINEDVSSDAVFSDPGNIFIGRSPYGNSGFEGCISDISYNNIRTLDMAMGSRHKGESDTITISKGVWEGCLLIPPSDWVAPALVPLTISNDAELNPNTVNEMVKIPNTTYSNQSTTTYNQLSGLLITLFLMLQFG